MKSSLQLASLCFEHDLFALQVDTTLRYLFHSSWCSICNFVAKCSAVHLALVADHAVAPDMQHIARIVPFDGGGNWAFTEFAAREDVGQDVLVVRTVVGWVSGTASDPFMKHDITWCLDVADGGKIAYTIPYSLFGIVLRTH
ncbi:uncharacterized protein EDB91DRAFT_1087455 [Suillus paluster]|uniref:uncharacterized protein n=1 Tax=Suillus paluster TaxID=48578 RepID=UPI001B872469|nr:uncharacterized protein EDB91DRAFT_1088525 [Suillus paluster]XP_041170472.1 uncharacterized protein EDB91DRAFT_1087455 [Suillus paluster]KAG1721238.1 hypothetical protein EDB91DRAFT_1088525 [Suillus paluster]KAG1724437.1 hypothetical protein EDB91DRAFT_1087455 [Suillus paluster]